MNERLAVERLARAIGLLLIVGVGSVPHSSKGAEGAPAPPCLKVADVNDDGAANIADAVALLGHLFGGDTGGYPNPHSGIEVIEHRLQGGEERPDLDQACCLHRFVLQAAVLKHAWKPSVIMTDG